MQHALKRCSNGTRHTVCGPPPPLTAGIPLPLLLSSVKPVQQEGSNLRDGLVRVGSLRQGRDKDGAAGDKTAKAADSTSTVEKRQASSVSDSLGAAMPGSFLTATDLQELARVYVVCLK